MGSTLSQSIVMRIKEFGETDLLVNFFSEDFGRLKGVAKGARKSKKRFPNCLDIFSLVKMEYQKGRKGDLYFLNSCRLIHGFPGLRRDYSSISLASYMIELTEILFPIGVPDEGMFELLKKSLYLLENEKRHFAIRLSFECRAMALGGFEIALDRCADCGRKYIGEGRAVFLVGAGGIACLKCRNESRLFPGLSPESVSAIRGMQKGSFLGREAPILERDSADEIKAVLKLHMEYRLSRSLKTSAYLD